MCSVTEPLTDSPQQTRRGKWRRIFLVTVIVLTLTLLFFLGISADIVSLARPQFLTNFLSSEDTLEPPPIYETSDSDYDLGNILNIKVFKSLHDHEPIDIDRIQQEAEIRPGSIIALYAGGPSECYIYPSVARLRGSVEKYFYKNHKVQGFAVRDATLVIHHDPVKLDMLFVRTAVDLSRRFKRVRLLIPDARLANRFRGPRVIVHENATSDNTVAFMLMASHLLVHTGETSAIGALVAKGTVYHTDTLSEYTSQNAFKWLLHNRVPLSPEKVSPYVPSLNHVGPVHPTCCDFEPFGKGDEERAICINAGNFTPPCWILAAGSAGQFGFETDVFHKTKCHVHTFDCTGEWEVPKEISHRVTFHKLCLGGKNNGLFKTMKELIKIGSNAMMGTRVLKIPAFVKMDIEGYEFAVIRALVENSDDDALPQQIAMEVHQHTTMSVGAPYVPVTPGSPTMFVTEVTISELFSNLSKKGYDLVYRADNPFCPQCSEVTVVRRDALPAD